MSRLLGLRSIQMRRSTRVDRLNCSSKLRYRSTSGFNIDEQTLTFYNAPINNSLASTPSTELSLILSSEPNCIDTDTQCHSPPHSTETPTRKRNASQGRSSGIVIATVCCQPSRSSQHGRSHRSKMIPTNPIPTNPRPIMIGWPHLPK